VARRAAGSLYDYLGVRTFFAQVFFIVSAIAVLGTVAMLALAFSPQDSSVPATRNWEPALIPAAMAVCALWAGLALMRDAKQSHERSR
jgi:hypothetical protein